MRLISQFRLLYAMFYTSFVFKADSSSFVILLKKPTCNREVIINDRDAICEEVVTQHRKEDLPYLI